MKPTVLAAFGALIIMLSADVGQLYRQNGSSADICNNCTTLDVTESVPSDGERAVETKSTIAAVRHPSLALDANGNPTGVIVSAKTGARARVGRTYAARFQAYIDDLESNYGARVLFMGGIRPGRCSSSSEHPCGKALDVCQLRRGVVDRRCKLPSRVVLGQVAAAHGLFEGGRWCNSDYGHAQVGTTAGACGERRIARQ
ncbi:MAG: hypothetical protein WA669_17380 [Pseudolabrys sp.]